LENALKLSEKAISHAKEPGPYFYETRGQILLRLERYLDAIPDLERALKVDQLAKAAHESLSLCYKHLDEPELASEHASAAEAMKSDDRE